MQQCVYNNNNNCSQQQESEGRGHWEGRGEEKIRDAPLLLTLTVNVTVVGFVINENVKGRSVGLSVVFFPFFQFVELNSTRLKATVKLLSENATLGAPFRPLDVAHDIHRPIYTQIQIHI